MATNKVAQKAREQTKDDQIATHRCYLGISQLLHAKYPIYSKQAIRLASTVSDGEDCLRGLVNYWLHELSESGKWMRDSKAWVERVKEITVLVSDEEWESLYTMAEDNFDFLRPDDYCTVEEYCDFDGAHRLQIYKRWTADNQVEAKYITQQQYHRMMERIDQSDIKEL